MRAFMRRAIAAIALVLMLAVPTTASAAYDIHTNIDCSQASASTVCQSRSTADPVTGPNGILHSATNLIATIAGVAAVIVMVLGGIRYVTSNGDAEAVGRAKKTIIYAAVGLVVIGVARQIINLVISKV